MQVYVRIAEKVLQLVFYDLRNERIKFADDWQKLQVNPLPPNVDTGSFVIMKKNVEYFRRNK